MINAQIDRLGERLRLGNPNEADLRLLDEHRGSFAEAYEHVIGILRDQLALAPTGRKAKTTASIIAKLQRQAKTRLSQIQDIAGCRVVVKDLIAQRSALAAIDQAFADAKVDDRTKYPSYGYRAFHVIVKSGNREKSG